jgi:hypothetical protein
VNEIRRLRAALGASADALLSRGADPKRLLEEEVGFLTEVCQAIGRPELLSETWRELRNRALVIAAHMEPNEQSAGVLRARLERDDATR